MRRILCLGMGVALALVSTSCDDNTNDAGRDAGNDSGTGGIVVCDEGFEPQGASCVDVNECERGMDNCSANATCTNLEGSFSCACNEGFEGDGVRCVVPNAELPCRGLCADEASCVDSPTGERCVCDSGFVGTGVTCTDVNECGETVVFERPDGADSVVDCVSDTVCLARGSFGGGLFNALVDDPSWSGGEGGVEFPSGTGWAPMTCAEAIGQDEVFVGWRDSHNANAASLPGKRHCLRVMATGELFDIHYTSWTRGSGGEQPDDGDAGDTGPQPRGGFAWERTAFTGICGTAPGTLCVNEPGGFSCDCAPGFEPDDELGCVDIDECAGGEIDCGDGAECVNAQGTWACRCPGEVEFEQPLGGFAVDCISPSVCLSRGDFGPIYNEAAGEQPGDGLGIVVARQDGVEHGAELHGAAAHVERGDLEGNHMVVAGEAEIAEPDIGVRHLNVPVRE